MSLSENEIGTVVVDTAIKIHQALGPGLLESVYEATIVYKLHQAGLVVRRQVSVPIDFEGVRLDEGFRADIIVENKVILELKSVETLHPVHKKQLLTYLKLSGLKLGYLLNFGEELMKQGITRVIHGHL